MLELLVEYCDMLIENRTKNTVVASNAIEASTFFQKVFGLVFYSLPVPLVFRTRFGIHTFFLKYEIDVLVLDEKNRVVDMSPYMKPWRIFVWDTQFSLVIELPAGSIGESKTRIGDQIGLV